MSDHELAEAIEVIPGRFFWVSLHNTPKSTAQRFFFSTDDQLVYEAFNKDFGPLDLAMICRYCKLVSSRLGDPTKTEKHIVHYCSHEPKRRANAALLACAYKVIVLHASAESAFLPFKAVFPPFLPYRDATGGVCTFQCTLLDCLKGLEKSIEIGWFDWQLFDIEQFEFFRMVEHGDMSWIIPHKFLAFAGPAPTSRDEDGYPAFTPEDYVPIFREAGIELVVRLNKKQYDSKRFINYGIKHADLYFKDGSCPSPDIITKFLHIAECEPGAIAVHCKAGLGRTGTLIALYAMKHCHFPARAFIAWNRICRPGSILGPQQQFLCDMERDMFQAGASLRHPGASLSTDAEKVLCERTAAMSIQNRQFAEQFEDYGQGERLRGARRAAQSNELGLASEETYGMGHSRPTNGMQQQPVSTVGKMKRSLRGMFSR
mmetsp:Transcript_21150/g.46631  ORF Transcript_21150/g.46631 Transcript_21150/m.46631 type:complete len:430 (-) Transcript_21150:324-1613(-)